MTSTFRFTGFQINTTSEWRDITDSLEDQSSPPTLAKPDGVGALQFTVARYKAGDMPSPSLETLMAMAHEFGEKKGLEEPSDEETFSGSVSIAGVSFDGGDDFIRVWYLSDGKNFSLATYICDWECRMLEVQECNEFVKSVRFTNQ